MICRPLNSFLTVAVDLHLRKKEQSEELLVLFPEQLKVRRRENVEKSLELSKEKSDMRASFGQKCRNWTLEIKKIEFLR